MAIMGDGKLKCCGSPLFLKRKYGLGYSMTIEKKDAITFDDGLLKNAVVSRIPNAVLLSNVGTEVVYQLPFSSTSLFQSLFEVIDKDSTIESYGLSVTTLEEVFIVVQNGTDTQHLAESGRDKIATDKIKFSGTSPLHIEDGEKVDSISLVEKIDENLYMRIFFQHLYALLDKRRVYFQRDLKSWIFLYFIPILFLLVGILVESFSSNITYQPLITLGVDMYNTNVKTNYFPLPYSSGSTFCTNKCFQVSNQDSIMNSIPYASNFPIYKGEKFTTIYNTSSYLLSKMNSFEASQIGAVSFVSSGSQIFLNESLNYITYVVHANYSALHGAPLVNTIVSSAILKTIDPTASLSVSLFPLPLTAAQTTVYSSFNIYLVVIFLLLSISVIPASFATHIVREREVKAKHQQIVSGVSFVVYWISHWIW